MNVTFHDFQADTFPTFLAAESSQETMKSMTVDGEVLIQNTRVKTAGVDGKLLAKKAIISQRTK